jgi:hypothetical protein
VGVPALPVTVATSIAAEPVTLGDVLKLSVGEPPQPEVQTGGGGGGGDVTVKVSLPQMLFSEALFASPL